MAAGDNRPFRNFVISLADGDGAGLLSGIPVVWDTDTIKVAFLSVAPDYDNDTTDIHWDDVSGDEVSSVGTYPEGGQTIASIAITWDADAVVIDGADVTVLKDASNGFTNAIAAVVYKDTGTPSTSPLLLYLDLGGAIGNTVADYVIQWGTNGIYRLPITDGV